MLENIVSKNISQELINKEIIIIYGGNSSERSVSILSGEAVYNALRNRSLNVLKYEFTNDVLSLLNFLMQKKNNIIVFNALHGGIGEDGTLPALLKVLNIPFTHSEVTASAIGMNKSLSKEIALANNILIAKGSLININDLLYQELLNFPFIVKANNEGSSVDVYLINSKKDLEKAIKNCKHKYREVLIEEYIKGEEFSVSIINGKALDITQIIPQNGNNFYNYDAKYGKGGSLHILPAKINHNLREYMLNCSEKLYKVIGCKGVARVDFKEQDNKVYFLEINTHPGFTLTSLLPEQAKYCNISFEDLCLFLLKDAISK